MKGLIYWLTGSTKTADPPHVECVLSQSRDRIVRAAKKPDLNEYREILDAAKKKRRSIGEMSDPGYEFISDEDLVLLHHYRDTLGILPGQILKMRTQSRTA